MAETHIKQASDHRPSHSYNNNNNLIESKITTNICEIYYFRRPRLSCEAKPPRSSHQFSQRLAGGSSTVKVSSLPPSTSSIAADCQPLPAFASPLAYHHNGEMQIFVDFVSRCPARVWEPLEADKLDDPFRRRVDITKPAIQWRHRDMRFAIDEKLMDAMLQQPHQTTAVVVQPYLPRDLRWSQADSQPNFNFHPRHPTTTVRSIAISHWRDPTSFWRRPLEVLTFD